MEVIFDILLCKEHGLLRPDVLPYLLNGLSFIKFEIGKWLLRQ